MVKLAFAIALLGNLDVSKDSGGVSQEPRMRLLALGWRITLPRLSSLHERHSSVQDEYLHSGSWRAAVQDPHDGRWQDHNESLKSSENSTYHFLIAH